MSLNDRALVLRPLYGAGGPITVELGHDTDEYRRGDVRVEVDAGDRYLFESVSALVRWESWLRKARKGTLRWLVEQNGMLSAGDLGTTTSVRSQLYNAGLAKPSHMWGDSVTEDCYHLRAWAFVELERRSP